MAVYEFGRSRQSVRRLHRSDEVVKRRAQSIDVAARVSAESLDLFQRRIVWRVAINARGSCNNRDAACLSLREPEIQQDDLPAASQLKILRLDVAMDNWRVLRVQIIERVEQLISPGQNLVGRKRSLFAGRHLRQVLAGNELHHEKLSVAFREVVANPRECRMMHSGK